MNMGQSKAMTKSLQGSVLPASGPAETTADTIARLMDSIERYAGWLSSSQNSAALRKHAHSLGTAVTAGADTWTWINLLDGDLKKLPSGEIPKMLRRTLTEISAVLESTDHEKHAEQRV